MIIQYPLFYFIEIIGLVGIKVINTLEKVGNEYCYSILPYDIILFDI